MEPPHVENLFASCIVSQRFRVEKEIGVFFHGIASTRAGQNRAMDSDFSFEDRYGPLARRANRLRRAVRWRVKCALRAPARILVETRWRLGDEIMALPIYETLKAEHPYARV
ncbi:MAG: hypothetical protein WC655_29970, partial [Candidatus Hydrogenedentales bacterium]